METKLELSQKQTNVVLTCTMGNYSGMISYSENLDENPQEISSTLSTALPPPVYDEDGMEIPSEESQKQISVRVTPYETSVHHTHYESGITNVIADKLIVLLHDILEGKDVLVPTPEVKGK